MDSAGALPGAQVSLSSPDVAVSRSTVTDTSGAYTFADLPAATYSLEAKLPGFVTATASARVVAGKSTRHDFQLAVGPVTEPSFCPQWHWVQDIAVGYSVSRESATDKNLGAGWTFDVAGGRAFAGWQALTSWVGELSGSYRTSGAATTLAPANIHTIVGGVRRSLPLRLSNMAAFAQALAGAARINESSLDRSSTSYSMALQPGAALVWGPTSLVSRELSVRASIDVLFFPGASTSRGPDYRVSVKVVRAIPRWLCL